MSVVPFRRRRPAPQVIDLTAIRLVEPCPPSQEDGDTNPRPAPSGPVRIIRDAAVFACFVIWAAFLLKLW